MVIYKEYVTCATIFCARIYLQTNLNDMKNKTLLLTILALVIGVGSVVVATSRFDGTGFGNNEATVQQTATSGQSSGDYLQSLKVNQITGTINPMDVINAREQAEKIFKSGNAIGLNWQSKGPDNVGGRTRAILFDKRDAGAMTMYAASVTGCIWKTTNLGATWVKVNQANANLNVTCMVQTADNSIYAGTGENGITQGRGLYMSADGDVFTLVPGTAPYLNGSVLEWQYINELATDLTNGRIFAATNSGLKYKDAGSAEWKNAKFIDSDNVAKELSAFAFDVKVAGNGLVVASVGSKVYVANNGDVNGFINQSTRPSPTDTTNVNKLPATGASRIELAIAPSNNDIIYASMANEYFNMLNVYRSADKGETWNVIFPGAAQTLTDVFVGQGAIANTIAVYPNNPDQILLGGINMWSGKKVTDNGFFSWGNSAVSSSTSNKFSPLYLAANHHVYAFRPGYPNTFVVGNDGGISINQDDALRFRPIIKNYNVAQFTTVNTNGFGNVMGGTLGNGIQYIGDGGNSPISAIEVWNGDLNNTGVGGYQAISLINPNYFILSRKVDASGATQFRRTEDKGFSFADAFLASSGMTISDFPAPFVLYENFNDQNSFDTVKYRVLAKDTIKMGETFIVRSNNYAYPFHKVATQEMYKGEIHNIKDQVVAKCFLAMKDKIFLSKDVLDFTKTPAWWNIAKVTGIPTAIAYSADANHVFVGTAEGKVYRISNLIQAYNYERADVNSAKCVVATSLIRTFTDRKITSIAVDPNNKKHIIVTLANYGNNDYVYRSTNAIDSLPTFNSIQGNLPKAPVYASLIELNNSNTIILGTEFGVFTTNNAAAGTWEAESNGMATIPVYALQQQIRSRASFIVPSTDPNLPDLIVPAITNYGAIYAATFGRGIWESRAFVGIDEKPSIASPITPIVNVFPNPASDYTKVSISMSQSASVQIRVIDFGGRTLKSMNMGQLTPGNHEFSVEVRDLSKGTYMIQVIAGQSSVTRKFVVIR